MGDKLYLMREEFSSAEAADQPLTEEEEEAAMRSSRGLSLPDIKENNFSNAGKLFLFNRQLNPPFAVGIRC